MLKIIFALCYFFGITKIAYWINRNKQVVVTYHNIISDELYDEALHLGVSNTASEFRRQLEIIDSRFRVVTELGVSGTCVVTFDDGFQNNYSCVCPILGEFNFKAYFFIPVSMINESEILWVDKILYWLSYVPPSNYCLAGVGDIVIKEASSRLHCWKIIWNFINSNYSTTTINNLIVSMNEVYDFGSLDIDQNLFHERFGKITESQMIEMKLNGHMIGAHSVSHDILSKISFEDLQDDFKNCEKYLQIVYNTNVFSYPFGGTNEVTEREVNLCQASMFSAAFINIPVSNSRSMYEIGRICLGRETNRYVIEGRLSGLDAFLRKLYAKRIYS